MTRFSLPADVDEAGDRPRASWVGGIGVSRLAVASAIVAGLTIRQPLRLRTDQVTR
jgi:hypothetical protein